VAIRKVCGIETEYGIDPRGMGEKNPIAASSVLINAYVNELQRKVGWDFEDEQPGNDARGFAREGAMPPEVETHLVNAVLTNGARYYVDHAHPEFSTPECADPLECVLFDKAGERILARSMEAAARALPNGQGIVVYKNNSDRKGNSYGTHENYLMDRQAPFARVVQHVMPHFVSRQIYTGAGKRSPSSSPSGPTSSRRRSASRPR
jgi:proteasome accessory factor A